MQISSEPKHVIFLDGPIGVGKTTYGQHLAKAFAGEFLDGDDYCNPNTPWFASSLSTSRGILDAALATLDTTNIVFIAYPIRCLNWVFFKRRLQSRQIGAVLVGLRAPLSAIASDDRSRRLSKGELKRSGEMISQGYGSRSFSDFFVQTDAGNETEVLAKAADALRETLKDRENVYPGFGRL